MSPPASENSSSTSNTPLRQVRIEQTLWDNAALVAQVLGSDRSALMREFWRWMTFEDGAKMPRRPAERPEGIRHADALPAGIQQVTEGNPKSKSPGRTRYVVFVDAPIDAVLTALQVAGVVDGLTYMSTDPVSVSALDRTHALKMHEALTGAGLRVVES